MSNFGCVSCCIYLLGKSLNSTNAEASQSASTSDVTDCLSHAQHSEYRHFCEVGPEIKRSVFGSHCCIVT